MDIAALLVPVDGGPSKELDRTLKSWLEPSGRPVKACLLPSGPPAAAQELKDWAAARQASAAGSLSIHAGPTAQWGGLEAASFALFALPGDVLDPGLALLLARAQQERSADVLVFNEERSGNPACLIRRPRLERYTLWHAPYIGRAFAVKAELVKAYPRDVARQLRGDDAHLFQLWLSGKPELRWNTHPEVLIKTGLSENDSPFAPSIEPFRSAYREAFASLGESFQLVEKASGELPYRLRPRRAARMISVIIPFRDRPEETRRCLDSVLKQRLSAELEIVLVDNQSQARSLDRIRDFLQERGAADKTRWLHYDAPFNHSRQCNLGAAAARGEALLLLNNDAELVDEDMVEEMAAWAMVPDVGTVGCRMTDRAGRLVSAGIKARARLANAADSPVEKDRSPVFAGHVRETYANTFACAAISKERLGAGGVLDEAEFPNGYNDVEYCLRLREAGYRHIYLGHLRAKHVPGTSRGRLDESREKLLLRRRFPGAEKDGLLQLECLKLQDGARAIPGRLARKLRSLPIERWARRLGARHPYRWAYRAARVYALAGRLLGQGRAPRHDLVFIVPRKMRGWILEGICNEVRAHFSGDSAFHYALTDPPAARAYFLCHYGLLPGFLKLNPSVWGAKILVHYTHSRKLPVSDEEIAFACNQATQVICPNSDAARRLRSSGVARDKVSWIPAGADPGIFKPHSRGGGAIGFSMAYYERKRPDRVLEIVRGMPHRRFLMLGKGWREWPGFQELVRLPHFTYLEVPHDQYPRYYACMDVLVSPGVLEGGPIPLIEAMMSNVVPVASRTGFAPDIIRHGENGFLFDPEASAEEIIPLIEEACRLEADVRSSAKHLSWENYAARIRLLIFGRPNEHIVE